MSEPEPEYSPYDSYTNTTNAAVLDAPAKLNGYAPMTEPEPVKTINIDLMVTRERLRDIEVGYFMDYEENPRSTRAQVGFLSNFVSDGEGNYLEKDEAVKVIRKLNFTQLNQSIIAITKMIKETAVPNE